MLDDSACSQFCGAVRGNLPINILAERRNACMLYGVSQKAGRLEAELSYTLTGSGTLDGMAWINTFPLLLCT